MNPRPRAISPLRPPLLGFRAVLEEGPHCTNCSDLHLMSGRQQCLKGHERNSSCALSHLSSECIHDDSSCCFSCCCLHMHFVLSNLLGFCCCCCFFNCSHIFLPSRYIWLAVARKHTGAVTSTETCLWIADDGVPVLLPPILRSCYLWLAVARTFLDAGLVSAACRCCCTGTAFFSPSFFF